MLHINRVTIDFAMPEPSPPPMMTIAWRLGHVIVGVLAARNAVLGGAEQVHPRPVASHIIVRPPGAFSINDFLGTIGSWAAGGAGIGATIGCVGVGAPTAVAGAVIGPEGVVLGGAAGCMIGGTTGFGDGGVIGGIVGTGVAIWNAF